MSATKDLEKLREWLMTYPGATSFSGYKIDYTDQIPANAGVFPSGLVEVNRAHDILGGCEVTNQYNFGLYYVFEKSPGDDDGATVNADWVMDFQSWVQEQSIRKLAPTFGDVPNRERITAENGVMYDATDQGYATYMVQLSVQFTKIY